MAIRVNIKNFTAFLGETTVGHGWVYLISVDAVLVLCGAVLTSLWVSGLLNRMTLDNLTKLL
jgi:hypothetical protein